MSTIAAHMLHKLQPAPGARKNKKRIARGNSAGGGTTAGRGSKGQLSRKGNTKRVGFEGGQTPLLRRQPKFGGFTNPNRKEYEVINVATLEEKLTAGAYTIDDLRTHNMLSTKKPVKILGTGAVQKKFTLSVDAASRSAIAAIEKVGGKVIVNKTLS